MTPTPPLAEACRSCGARVLWATTESGKLMPIDPEPDAKGTLHLWRDALRQLHVRVDPYSITRYRAHFATCPDAESWRKR